MHRRLLAPAVAVVALAGAGVAAADVPKPHAPGPRTVVADPVAFEFSGRLVRTEGTSALVLRVTGGNRRAVLRLVGHAAVQRFTVGRGTRFLVWRHGVPAVASLHDLRVGDRTVVRVLGARSASLGRLRSTRAALVSDHTARHAPRRPLWRFVGTVNGRSDAALALHVTDGNHRALRAMLGQAQDQTFAVNARTIVLRWSRATPTTIRIADLKVGDRVAVNVRAAGTATLAQVEATPVGRISAS